MSILGDDDSLLGSTPSGSENNYIASLGRISGKLLTANLQRNGQDLTFRNGPTDADLLYLDVNNMRVGINTDSPVYDLDINSLIKTNDLTIINQATIDNIVISAPKTFSTTVGPIQIYINGSDLFHDRLTTSALEFNDNSISSFTNQNIVLDPNGTGNVYWQTNTYQTGDLSIAGNTVIGGNLSSASTIIVGDTPLDTVSIAPDFTQSIIPGIDNNYDLGQQANDSSPRRWAELHSPDWTNVTNFHPMAATVSSQLTLDGVINKISAIQSNEDVLLNPDSGITYIERTKWQDNEITNLNNTPLTFANTGIGYTRYMGTNAVVIPSGTTAEQRIAPELGETRWNTDVGYLECFDGTVWVVSTGGGEEVTTEIMEDLGHVYTLMLG